MKDTLKVQELQMWQRVKGKLYEEWEEEWKDILAAPGRWQWTSDRISNREWALKAEGDI